VNRGEVDDEFPLAACGRQTVGAEYHFLHGRGVREARGEADVLPFLADS